MAKVILLLCLVLTPWMAFSKPLLGHDQGNGGDNFVAEFRSYTSILSVYLSTQKEAGLDLLSFRELANTVKVESTLKELKLDGVSKDAINYPASKRIIFNRTRWQAASYNLKMQLVMHEFLGLMGDLDVEYRKSSDLLRNFDYCVQTTPRERFLRAAERGADEYCQGVPFENLRVSTVLAKSGSSASFYTSWSCGKRSFVGELSANPATSCILISNTVRETFPIEEY